MAISYKNIGRQESVIIIFLHEWKLLNFLHPFSFEMPEICFKLFI
jgi:hypothetical protein